MPDTPKKTSLIRKQTPMRRVILATVPCMLGSIYYFGWRSLAVILVSCGMAFAAEYVFCRQRKEPVSQAAFVTAVLYALAMPPTIPWHVLVIGVLFAIVFVKEAFGGFGRNVFNPAVAGRCFVYICFPIAMTSTWAPAARGPLGALLQWTTVTTPNAVTSATPLALMKAGGFEPTLSDLLHGLFLGRMAGTMGVTSALLILIGGGYLLYAKTVKLIVPATLILTYAGLTQCLHWLGVAPVPNALPAVLGGGFLFGALFMATDPVSSPSTNEGRIAYAILIAICAVVIRNFSIFNGGLMFAILLGNMFAPIIDHAVKARKK
ncbi:RnfABCDGE type electron transport complex subunit D [Verrucomicrobiota bacterium]